MDLKLRDIFVLPTNQCLYSKQELYSFMVNRDFLYRMNRDLNLNYLEKSFSAGNVCYVNSDEVRPEFRTFFTKIDIVFYVTHKLDKDLFDKNTDRVPFPFDAALFFGE